jgi:hypothetical protein
MTLASSPPSSRCLPLGMSVVSLEFAQVAELLPTRSYTRSPTQAPRTTATVSSSYRSSTAFIWHSRGVRCPPRRLPALRTSSPSISRSPSSLPNAVSRGSSPRIGRPSRSCVSASPARVSRDKFVYFFVRGIIFFVFILLKQSRIEGCCRRHQTSLIARIRCQRQPQYSGQLPCSHL